jgi:hypothetical protein
MQHDRQRFGKRDPDLSRLVDDLEPRKVVNPASLIVEQLDRWW